MKTLILALALTLGSAAVSAAVECPIHDRSNPYATGKTMLTKDGILLYEYRCSFGGGHSFWVRK